MSESDEIQATHAFQLVALGEHTDGNPLVGLHGLLDAGASTRLTDELARYLQEGHKRIHVNLQAVSMITSSGVGALVSAIGDYRDAEGDVVLHGMSPEVRHVFELLALLSYVTVAD